MVVASADHEVLDRRRVPSSSRVCQRRRSRGGQHAAHRDGPLLTDDELADLVAEVRASAVRATSSALVEIADAVPGPILSMSLRRWPDDFPTDVAVQRVAPYEAQADSVMYRQVLSDAARDRGRTSLYDARTVEADAAALLGDRATAVLRGPRARLGPPWSQDHRMALAATVVLP